MRQRKPETEATPLDPIALSLALWLGLMVGALGLQHLSEQAAAQQRAAAWQTAFRQGAAGARATPAQAIGAWGG